MTMAGSRIFLCVVALFALSACGRASEVAPTGVPGVYHHGNAAEPGSLDPSLIQADGEDNIIGDMLMGLTTEDANAEPIPGMAESWETSADGLTWTFHLRDAKWSDGVPVTGDDFVFAWRRTLAPETASYYAYYLYLIKNAEAVNAGKMPGTALGISAPDPKTVVVTLEHPAPYLTEYLVHTTTMPMPRHVVEKNNNKWAKPGTYVSNGPFLLKEWVPNDHITLVKNPLFYDAANVKLNTVLYYPTVNYLTALTWFRAGLLDDQDRLPVALIGWVRKNMPEVLHKQPVLLVEYLAFNFTRKPLQDARVREALDLALDRDTIVNKVRMTGDVPAYSIVPPGTANYPGGTEPAFKALPYPERVRRAQQLMRAAGYGPDNRLRLELSIRSPGADQMRVPVAIQQNYSAIYVDIVIVQNDFAVAMANWNRQNFDIADAAWGADFNDAISFLDLMHTGNGNNFWKYSNPAYDALLDRASHETDITRRGALLAEAEKLSLKDHPWAPVFFWITPEYTRPYVKGWVANSRDKHRSRWISIAP